MKCICMYVYLHVLNDNIRVPVIHEFCIPSFRMKDNNFKLKKTASEWLQNLHKRQVCNTYM